MENGKHLVYEFGGFQLDPARQKLFRNGQPVALTPKAFETLLLLVQNRHRTLLKDQLMQALWAGTFVEEANLSQNIFLLRKALGDDRNGHSFIHTVPRRGYRFVAPVTETEVESIVSLPGERDLEFWKKYSPFRSLTIFEEADAWLFFGREAERADLVKRVVGSAVVALVGNSGSGKSSLLRAGLIPALREGRLPQANGSPGALSGDSWRIAVFRPSAAPFDCLAEVLPGQLAPELNVKEQAEFIADCRARLPEGGHTLRDAVAGLVSAATSRTGQTGHTRVLLVVDQFEELFTLTTKPVVRDRYIDSLLAAARLDGAVLVHLVLSLRADFYGHCLDHSRLSRCLETSFNLGSMRPEHMRETTEKRLQLAGGRAEPGLIDSLLEEVGAEPGNLALLEHALGQLWERCGGVGCIFTNRAYAEMGRLRGALGRHADEVVSRLDDGQQLLAQEVFLELVHLGEGAQDTRRRVAKAELLALGESAQVEQLLARLASSRLIAMGREGEETFVEVSHEALIREWPALRKWLAENREDLSLKRRLEQAADEWESLNRDPGALLHGVRLAQAEDWLARNQDAPDLLSKYVQASVEARAEAIHKEREAQQRELSRQKQTARWFRWFSYALGILLIMAAGSAWYAYRQRVLEHSRAMAAEAEELAPRDHGRALDLALRSWQVAKTEEAHVAIARTIPELQFSLGHEDAVYRTVFSPDGRRVLTVAHDHAAKLWNAGDGKLLAVLPHDDAIEHADFSPDGRRIVTASDDRTARIWDGADGHLLAVLSGHVDKLWRASFARDGQRVITASADNTARIWNSGDGKLLVTLTGHSSWVFDAQFSPDGQRVVTASVDRTARVWDAFTGRLIFTLKGHSDLIGYAEFSPDGQRIVTAGYDGTARIWSTSDGRLLYVLKHRGPVRRAVFSHDNLRIATASSDNTVGIWDSRDGHLLASLRHEGPVAHVEFSLDDRRIATASYDHTARVWSSRGDLLAVLLGHSRELYHAAFSPSGDRVVTGSGDHTARIWNLQSGRSTTILRQNSAIQFAAVSQDGKLIATASDDHTARVWNASDGRLRFVLGGHSDRLWRVAFSPDSQRIVSAGIDGSVRLWNSRDGGLIADLQGHTAWVNDLSFSQDSSRLVTSSQDHTARLWSARDGRLLAILQDASPLASARFSPDGRRIATAARALRIWDGFDGHPLATLEVPGDSLSGAAFSSGNTIVTGSLKGDARIWSADGRLLRILQPQSGALSALSFLSDSKQVAGVGGDKQTIFLWNCATGRLLNSWKAHTDMIWRLTMSPVGLRLATASMDQTARLWDANDSRILATLQGHTGWVSDVKFFPDGRRLVTTSSDQTARIWEVLTLDDIARILSK